MGSCRKLSLTPPWLVAYRARGDTASNLPSIPKLRQITMLVQNTDHDRQRATNQNRFYLVFNYGSLADTAVMPMLPLPVSVTS